MQKLAAAALQIALVLVAVHGASACSTERAVVKKSAAVVDDTDTALRAELKALEAKGPLHFETDTEVLTSQSQYVLRQVAQQMFAHPRTKVIVSGHADERGDTAYNLALGERRGHAAREYLAKLGVPAARVRVVSLGEEAPIVPGHDESAWAENRRDEFTFVLPGQLADVTGLDGTGDPVIVAKVVYGEE